MAKKGKKLNIKIYDRNYKPHKDYYINKRIEHIDRIRTAYIMFKDIAIATISEESSSLSGEFDWVIKPIWKNWDEANRNSPFPILIPGIDETLRKDEYIRRYVPEFVTVRTIPDGRKDLPEKLEKLKLRYNDLFEFMCRTHGITNDYFYVSRTPDKIIDVFSNKIVPYDIPDFDTSNYGWLDTPIISE